MQRVERTSDRWRNRNSGQDALEDSIWIVEDLTAQSRERWVIGDRCLRHPFNQERTLLIIKKSCATPVNNESTRECAEGGKDGATPLFTNLHTSQEATTTDRARSACKRTFLKCGAACFQRAESSLQRCALRLGGARGTVAVANKGARLRLGSLRGGRRRRCAFESARHLCICGRCRISTSRGRNQFLCGVISFDHLNLRLAAEDARLGLRELR